jgi:hypothetical protein
MQCNMPLAGIVYHVSNQRCFHSASLSQCELQPLGAFFTIVRRGNSLADKTKTQSLPAAARADLFLNPANSKRAGPSIQPLPPLHIELIITLVPAAISRRVVSTSTRSSNGMAGRHDEPVTMRFTISIIACYSFMIDLLVHRALQALDDLSALSPALDLDGSKSSEVSLRD